MCICLSVSSRFSKVQGSFTTILWDGIFTLQRNISYRKKIPPPNPLAYSPFPQFPTSSLAASEFTEELYLKNRRQPCQPSVGHLGAADHCITLKIDWMSKSAPNQQSVKLGLLLTVSLFFLCTYLCLFICNDKNRLLYNI